MADTSGCRHVVAHENTMHDFPKYAIDVQYAGLQFEYFETPLLLHFYYCLLLPFSMPRDSTSMKEEELVNRQVRYMLYLL